MSVHSGPDQACHVTHSEDDFIQTLQDDHHIALWHVILSNGQKVIQDDNRPGQEVPSAWMRLRTYCDIHELTIQRLWLQFRSNKADELPPNAEGYFFSKSALRAIEMESTLYSYLIGYLQGEKVHILRYSVPELICIERITRDVTDKMVETLIRNR